MRRVIVLFALVMVLAVVVSGVLAKGKGEKAPKINGGGVIQNFNAGPTFGPMYTIGGFNARAKGEGTEVEFRWDVFGSNSAIAKVWEADGQIQLTSVPVEDPTGGTSVHGEVVCMANLGPAALIDGGGNPEKDVWEVRFALTKVDGQEPDLGLPWEGPYYGSLFFQDDGKADWSDESFKIIDDFTGQLVITDPACANIPLFQLEPFLAGQLKVH